MFIFIFNYLIFFSIYIYIYTFMNRLYKYELFETSQIIQIKIMRKKIILKQYI